MLAALLIAMLCAPTAASDVPTIRASDIFFLDDTHGWVSATEPTPTLLRTTDGGRTWTQITPPVRQGFYRLKFFDETVGMALAMESEQAAGLYRSSDGGQVWSKVNTIALPEYLTVVDLGLTSRDTGFMVGERSLGRGWVAQVLDSGRTITVRTDLPLDFDEQSNTLGVFGDSNGHVWIVGKELVVHSDDNGKTWENQTANAKPGFDLGMSGVALAGGHAWFAAANFNVYQTTDYGQHWNRVLDARQEGINFDSVSFFNIHEGCAVGSSSSIFALVTAVAPG